MAQRMPRVKSLSFTLMCEVLPLHVLVLINASMAIDACAFVWTLAMTWWKSTPLRPHSIAK